jgi:hypothetical protein
MQTKGRDQRVRSRMCVFIDYRSKANSVYTNCISATFLLRCCFPNENKMLAKISRFRVSRDWPWSGRHISHQFFFGQKTRYVTATAAEESFSRPVEVDPYSSYNRGNPVSSVLVQPNKNAPVVLGTRFKVSILIAKPRPNGPRTFLRTLYSVQPVQTSFLHSSLPVGNDKSCHQGALTRSTSFGWRLSSFPELHGRFCTFERLER